MSTLITKIRYRVYMYLGTDRYYANRSDPPTTKNEFRWRTKEQEYPDHFTWNEVKRIKDKWMDARHEQVVLQPEELND